MQIFTSNLRKFLKNNILKLQLRTVIPMEKLHFSSVKLHSYLKISMFCMLSQHLKNV